MKLRISAFLLASFALVACSMLPFGTQPAVPIIGPTITPTPPLDQPDGVAQTFLNAWMAGDYSGMYSLLSPNSQTVYTLETFTNIYTSTAAAMTLLDLEAVPLSVLSESTGTSAFFAFKVTYNTQVLGTITIDNQKMSLVFTDNRWGVVWSPALIFPELANGNTLQLEVETPSRANIYDRTGLPLVTADAQTYTITIVPGRINTNYEGQMLDLLSQVLRMPPADIKQNYDGMPADQAVALGDADAETIQANWSALNSYSSALGFIKKTGRRYFDLLAPHVLGYTSQITAEELDDYLKLGYQGDEIVGQSGLEKWGELYLAGTRGGKLNVYTSDGQFSQVLAGKDPQPAQSIYTTLDRNLQTIVQDVIQEAYDGGQATWAPTAGGAAVVVMDVNTGAVLAMASYPYFDPNVLNPFNNHPLYTETYLQDLFTNPRKPYLNRATQGEYPPGSIFKIVSMSTALGSGLFTPDTRYTCTGVWMGLGADTPRYDWLTGGHGTLTLRQALTASCNPYFYQVGLVTGEKDFNLIPSYARQYGFGKDLGIEIEENPGLIPDKDWLFKERGLTWTLDDSVNTAIGQGNVLVTPLQVATMISAVANGGAVYRPQLVDHIGLLGETPTVTFNPDVLNTLTLSEDELAVIRQSMHQVTADPVLGTAEYRLGSLNNQIQVAGKTGTAQVSTPGAPPNAWFGGFVPYDKPELAIVVMIENGGNGSTVVAPIFRRIVERYYKLPELPWPNDWSDPSIFDFVKDTTGE
jgi:penicillin-binding protein 2